MTAPKELVILAAQFDLVACRWSVASIDDQSVVDPLVQSLPDDLLNYRSGTFDERTSFLRHRIAGALQRGNDRLWGQQRKSELFAIEFATESVAVDGELIRRVAEHFLQLDGQATGGVPAAGIGNDTVDAGVEC